MWQKIRPLLFILSITLNLAFVGTWIGTFKRNSTTVCRVQKTDSDICCPLYRRIGINGAQWQQIEPRMREFNDSSRVQCARMRLLRSKLIDLIASEHIDRDSIALQQAQILAFQREMQKQVISHLLAQKKLLTPHQRSRLFQMMKEKIGCVSNGNSYSFPIGRANPQIPIESQK